MSKPYQWIIDDLTEDIEFHEQNGFDKENPELFARMKANLEKAKQKQREEVGNE